MKELRNAFVALRKQGLIAYSNKYCCQSCAGAAVAHDVTKAIDEGADRESIRGFVGYHSQAGENKRGGLDFHLNYGSVETEKYGVIGLPAGDVGRLVVEALTKFKVAHEWDGSPDKSIRIRGLLLNKSVDRDGVSLGVSIIVYPREGTSRVTLGRWGAARVWGPDSPVSGLGYVAWEQKEVGPMLDFVQERYPKEYLDVIKRS